MTPRFWDGMTAKDIRDVENWIHKRRRRWGNWHHWKRCQALVYKRDGSVLYEVDLADMKNAAACLDWIMQVTGKRWMTAKDYKDLIEAIRYLVDPQASICSWAIGSGAVATESLPKPSFELIDVKSEGQISEPPEAPDEGSMPKWRM